MTPFWGYLEVRPTTLRY